MTAAAHLAEFEAAGSAAVHAHLAFEHPATRVAGSHAAAHATPPGPDVGDWFALDDASPRSSAKAARLPVVRLPSLDRGVVRAGLVRGDSGTWYRCWVEVAGWRGACERGGAHDHTPDGAACSHPLALAAAFAAEDPARFPTRLEAGA